MEAGQQQPGKVADIGRDPGLPRSARIGRIRCGQSSRDHDPRTPGRATRNPSGSRRCLRARGRGIERGVMVLREQIVSGLKFGAIVTRSCHPGRDAGDLGALREGKIRQDGLAGGPSFTTLHSDSLSGSHGDASAGFFPTDPRQEASGPPRAVRWTVGVVRPSANSPPLLTPSPTDRPTRSSPEADRRVWFQRGSPSHSKG